MYSSSSPRTRNFTPGDDFMTDELQDYSPSVPRFSVNRSRRLIKIQERRRRFLIAKLCFTGWKMYMYLKGTIVDYQSARLNDMMKTRDKFFKLATLHGWYRIV